MANDRDDLIVSPALRRTVQDIGVEAERWLDGVPALIAETCAAWSIRVGRQLEHSGCASIILPATTDAGGRAVLKLSIPHDESRYEATALTRWRGDGAISVQRSSADGFTLLLERCEPGHDLWSASIDEQVTVLSDLLPRLWLPDPAGTFPDLADTAAAWERQLHADAEAMGVPSDTADRAQRWLAELAAHQPRHLLHGDLHPGNVLAAQRSPWLVIDPKPCVGDPAFDLAQVLLNWVRADLAQGRDAANEAREHATALAQPLAIDPDRALRWAVIKAICWSFGRDEAIILDEVARTLSG